MPNTLFLRLEGPMQSWGERARWSVRDTAPEPTKSGVVGLLACALGMNSDEDLRLLSRQMRIGVRCDRPGTPLTDYHTVVDGVMLEGKVRSSTVLSWRHYLCDASFLVAVQAAPALVARLAEAIQNPRWPIFLGRKSCPPSRPPFAGLGEYLSLEAALYALPVQANHEAEKARVWAVIECHPDEGVRRQDEVDSRSRRTFLPRYTQDVPIEVNVQLEESQ